LKAGWYKIIKDGFLPQDEKVKSGKSDFAWNGAQVKNGPTIYVYTCAALVYLSTLFMTAHVGGMQSCGTAAG
jgi:hypothetical protein